MTKTVFVSGNFNVLHPGHLRLFRFARELGGRLIVGVQSDRVAGDAAHILQGADAVERALGDEGGCVAAGVGQPAPAAGGAYP